MSIFDNGGLVGTFLDYGDYGESGIWSLRSTASVFRDLYNFSLATFTTGEVIGATGPSLTQARSGITGPEADIWKNSTEYFNTTDGIQLWTVPRNGTYRIEAAGAQGGQARGIGGINSGGGNYGGGHGRIMRGDFELVQGEVIRILVGQQGLQPPEFTGCRSGGGGGGTFVVRAPYTTNESILVIAGGGGGGGTAGGDGLNTGVAAVITQNGTSSRGNNTFGGLNGNGGGVPTSNCANYGSSNQSGSGGGFFTNGGAVGRGGFSFVNGGNGNFTGQFGGGGRSSSNNFNGGGGGGGGYSGGGGGVPNGGGTGEFDCGCSSSRGGGGGGSKNNGVNQSNQAEANFSEGQVTITQL